jgi:hypothetical protein
MPHFVVHHLGDGGQAVGGAAGIRHHRLPGIAGVVHAVDEHGRVVLAGGREHDFFRPCIKVFLRGNFVEEQARGLDHHLRAHVAPLQVGRVALLRQADALAVDDQGVAVHRHRTLEAAMHAVVLEHVGQVVRLQQVVDGDDADVMEVGDGGAKHHAPDAAKAVDADV